MLRALILAAFYLLLVQAPAWAQDGKDVKIATFNIQNFGKTKAGRPAILKYLAETVRQFDIVAVQELSDVTNKVSGVFLDAINKTGRRYAMLISERTGQQDDDHSSQEQYGFYYDTARIEALDQGALFDDSAKDLFQREPYTARFGVKGGSLSFTITEIHTQPTRAVAEIDALYTVYNDVMARYHGETNHIILGDFNGSCSYASPAQLQPLKIHGPGFCWVVPDGNDSTVSPNTSCAYDRIVLSAQMRPHLVKWGTANWFEDNAISDHWPVWASFK